MRTLTTVAVLAALCISALAAGDAAPTPQSFGTRRPATDGDLDAITIPRMLSYQGRLTDTLGEPVPNGSYSVAFRLYTQASGGTPFWNEVQSVQTSEGLFSVLLGAVARIDSVPDAGNLYLGMAVDGGAELAPRLRIVSAAYAYKADTADYALASAGGGAGAWVRGGDSVLYTVNLLGIAKGGAGNALHGNQGQTHVNLGVACTTGVSGQNRGNCTVGGGVGNVASGDSSVVCGGARNLAQGNWATVGGGRMNAAETTYATTSGGDANTARGFAATVGGGQGCSAAQQHATVGGGSNNTASGSAAVVSGGIDNTASGDYAAIGGGDDNSATQDRATVAGGGSNAATGAAAFVGGGSGNAASYQYATVAGGQDNDAAENWAAVVGGSGNRAGGPYAAVGGGSSNTASGNGAAIGGGGDNVASDFFATVPGGEQNAARGYCSFAAGRYARANHTGSFVWSDDASAAESVYTTANSQFRVRARGGTWFFSNAGQTTGAYLAPGSNSWSSACDRANKEDLRPVDRQELLEKVAALPVQDYKMRDQNDGTRHIGPVAQDFAAAFGYGENNTSINLADADGVALAAIQALYDRLEQQQAEIDALKAELMRR